jgi:NADH dehydrogenase
MTQGDGTAGAHGDGVHCVTGGLGYSGRFIARRLLERGRRVRTLTGSIDRPNPFGDALDIHPLAFDDPPALTASLAGVSVLYNTYWVRFTHGSFGHAQAVRNTIRLFAAAERAGVERIVHVSITNPAEDSELEYFRGKACLEAELRATGLSHAILRPAVLFGDDDILINNIAWMLRRLPIFGVFGDGSYRLQPIHVDDLAALAVAEGERSEDSLVQAIGPESFAYRQLVRTIGEIIGRPRRIVSVPPWLGHVVGRGIGAVVRDVVITRDEIRGLMEERLYVDAPPAGETRLTEWAREHADTLGRRYHHELRRRRS